jgi:RimJ/RimL family protein N-acetyltransferase
MEPLELWSQRLCLRRLLTDDASAIREYRCLPAVARYQSWESFELADAERLIAEQRGVVPGTPGTWLQLALILQETGNLIGDCGIHFRVDEPEQVEIGITLAPSHHRRGLAAEALGSVLQFVFGQLGKHRVTAFADVENHAAENLLRRLGFRQEAHYVENVWFKGSWGSELLFARLRREWQAEQ